jgi:hypothetical protein
MIPISDAKLNNMILAHGPACHIMAYLKTVRLGGLVGGNSDELGMHTSGCHQPGEA